MPVFPDPLFPSQPPIDFHRFEVGFLTPLGTFDSYENARKAVERNDMIPELTIRPVVVGYYWATAIVWKKPPGSGKAGTRKVEQTRVFGGF